MLLQLFTYLHIPPLLSNCTVLKITATSSSTSAQAKEVILILQKITLTCWRSGGRGDCDSQSSLNLLWSGTYSFGDRLIAQEAQMLVSTTIKGANLE
jgi:hypothetical protein